MAELFRSAANLVRAVAELFGSAVAGEITGRILSSHIANYRRGRNLEESLEKLEELLLEIYSAVDASVGKPITNRWLLQRLSKFQDAMREGEGAQRSLRRCIDNSGSPSFDNGMHILHHARNFFWVSEDVFRLRNTIESLEKVVVDVNKFIRLLELERDGRLYRSISNTTASKCSKVVGLHKEREAIIKILLQDDIALGNDPILAIVGMGGIGKTTLADLVYNDERTKKHFSLAMWIRVPKQLDMAMVAKSISGYLHCNYHNDDSLTLARLQEIIKDKLSSHRFLLVLDDVPEEGNKLLQATVMDCVKSGKEGSKVLITTRSGKAAKSWDTVRSIVRMSPLALKSCSLSFNLSAFPEYSRRLQHPELITIGKRIVGKLGGHPLSARLLGHALRDNLHKEYWNDVLHSEFWESTNNLLPSLNLSYHLLPGHLQRCFAFLGKLPKGWEFTRESLTSLWVAEGLAHSNNKRNKKSAEDLGSEYFDELLSKSFIQRHRHKPGFFTVHDLLHDLAVQAYDSSSCSTGHSNTLWGAQKKNRKRRNN
ncbi:Disease resistance protein (CC-NBS-LRR class) family [Rhynchospora pubera]|uniref:Disease resistance protein (CC-NBS-LRR class) family n=1 Tax=Rhynchospora pubera TaxID=906938 RepID=A0AAV8DGE0_9POAL|nr:Disease resistance protein (CC-NBS-LRR class) family [Rhynchospora pubera]